MLLAHSYGLEARIKAKEVSVSVSGAFKLIKAARVMPCTGEGVIERGAVLVEGQVIRAVGPEHQVRAPEGASVEEYSFPEHTVLPGLVDVHTHQNNFGDGRSGDDLARLPDELLTLQTHKNLLVTLRSGVTSARDNGAKNYTTLRAKEAMAMGIFIGPRLMVCGQPMAITGGHMWYFGIQADGVDAVRREVRRLVKEGADYIKITATGGSTRTSIPLRPSFTVDELKAIVEEAHKFGKLTGAHCASTQGTINSLEAGVDMIIHCHFRGPDGSVVFREDVAERIARQGACVNPTLHINRLPMLRLQAKAQQGPLAPEERARLDSSRRYWEQRQEQMRRMAAMGVRIVAGSDSAWGDYPLGGFVHELEALVDTGFSPARAILAATRDAADSIGLGRMVGTLEPGKAADILAVSGDPTRDIRALWKVKSVFLNGNLVHQA